MSVHQICAAYASEIRDPAELLLVLVFADAADDSGYVVIDDLAQFASKARATVETARGMMRRLQADGHLSPCPADLLDSTGWRLSLRPCAAQG